MLQIVSGADRAEMAHILLRCRFSVLSVPDLGRILANRTADISTKVFSRRVFKTINCFLNFIKTFEA